MLTDILSQGAMTFLSSIIWNYVIELDETIYYFASIICPLSLTLECKHHDFDVFLPMLSILFYIGSPRLKTMIVTEQVFSISWLIKKNVFL